MAADVKGGRGAALLAFILLLGAIVVIAVQMAGAILYMTTVMPPRALLRVLARYLKHGKEEEPVDLFPPFETMTRLLKIRRRSVCLIVAVAAAGAAAGAACAFWSPGAVAYVVPACLVAAVVLLIFVGALTVWIRQCRAMRDADWMDTDSEEVRPR